MSEQFGSKPERTAACIALAMVAVLSTSASAAVTFTTSGYVTSDPGAPTGDMVIDNFTSANPLAPSAGVSASFYSSGSGACTPTGSLTACADTVGVSVAAGGTNAGGVAPAGDQNKSYLAVGANAADDVSFAVLDVSKLKPLSNISFYWGSADNYNFAQLLDGSGNVVAGSFVSGNSLGVPVNAYGFGGQSFRFTYDFTASDHVAAIEFGEGYGSAFELTDVATDAGASSAMGGVPEPAPWAMMLGGFGLAGASLRRRARGRVTLSA